MKKAAVLLLTSNRGMAGGFNANLIKEARALITTLEGDGTVVELHVSGQKGVGYFRYIGRAMATRAPISATSRRPATRRRWWMR